MPKATDWKGVRTTKTSVELPEATWKAAKIRALEEGRNLQEVIADALAEYLKKPSKGGKR
jgi:hypothetical protein